MVHYAFWLFSGGAPASQEGGGGVPKPPSHPAAARRSSVRGVQVLGRDKRNRPLNEGKTVDEIMNS